MTPTPSTSRTPTPALDAALDEWSLTREGNRNADTFDVDDETARAQTRRGVTLLASTTGTMTLSELADELAADTRVRWTGADRSTGTPAGGPTTP